MLESMCAPSWGSRLIVTQYVCRLFTFTIVAFGKLFHPEWITEWLNFHDSDKQNKLTPSEDIYVYVYFIYLMEVISS